jgi:hypothetical protein
VQRLSLSKGPGFHYIIPSFFKTIKTLEARGQSFSIVFRTFGDDLPDVMEAVADFCTGKVLSQRIAPRGNSMMPVFGIACYVTKKRLY